MESSFPVHDLAPAEAFRRAVEMIGSQVATGELVGMTQSAISQVLSAKKACPLRDGAVLKIEAATGIPRWVLRPDIYPRDDSAALDHRPDHNGGTDLEPAR